MAVGIYGAGVTPKGPYLAVGVDVAESRKGLDLVAIDSDRQVVACRGRLTGAETVDMICEELGPAIVCIDSPSGWARSGRSRLAERELARRGVQAYATPADPGDHPFYRWMRVGQTLYDALAHRFPLFKGHDPEGTAAEVYPNASAVFLAGRRRAVGEPKGEFRRAVLRAAGVDDRLLANIDAVDAALGALTGLLALDGTWTGVGDPEEGVILLPVGSASPYPIIPVERLTSRTVPKRRPGGELRLRLWRARPATVPARPRRQTQIAPCRRMAERRPGRRRAVGSAGLDPS